VFVVELATLFALTDWTATKEQVDRLLDGNRDLTAAVSLIVLSGGLGAIFSHIHHFLHWTIWGFWGFRQFQLAAHHRRIAERLGGIVTSAEAQAVRGEVAALRPLLRRDWVALTALWYMRVKDRPRIESATQRTVELSDLVHSNGAMLVAFMCAAGLWLWKGSWGYLAGGVALVLAIIHFFSYAWTSRLARDTIEAILFSDLAVEALEEGEPHPPSQP
jgi:hypothetical protein